MDNVVKSYNELTSEVLTDIKKCYGEIIDNINNLLEHTPYNFSLGYVNNLNNIKEVIDRITYNLDEELKTKGIYDDLGIKLIDNTYFMRYDYKMNCRQFKNICEIIYNLKVSSKNHYKIFDLKKSHTCFLEYQKIYAYSNITFYDFTKIIKFTNNNLLSQSNHDYLTFYNIYNSKENKTNE